MTATPVLARRALAVVIFAACLAALARTARAHDFWSNGSRVDPLTKQLCCGQGDHIELTDDQVTRVPGGYEIMGDFVDGKSIQPSPDSRWHINRWGGRVRCTFGPLSF